QPHRGLLRAGPGLLVRGRSGPGEADLGTGVQGEQVQPLGQEVSGHAAARAPGRGAAAHLALLALFAQAPPPDPVRVGPVPAVAWPAQLTLAVALAEAGDRAAPFPGVGPLPARPIRLLLAPDRARFDSLTRGRLPRWSEGAAFPEAGTVVLLAVGPPDHLAAALRHELAHLALRWRAGRRLPLWFEEGYAAVAAAE